MAPRPFPADPNRPPPLTVEETAEKFGVSMSVVREAQRILMRGGKARKAGRIGSPRVGRSGEQPAHSVKKDSSARKRSR